jgi:hypothetical protein
MKFYYLSMGVIIFEETKLSSDDLNLKVVIYASKGVHIRVL